MSWHDLAKQLSHYLYFFSFLFLFGLTTQESNIEKYHMSNVTCHSHMAGSDVTWSQMESHNKCGKLVHRPCSSCISNVQNLIKTLLSPPCQLG